MSRSELVDLYLAGRLSRRTFIRGLMLAGVSAGAAATYATVLSRGAEADPRGPADPPGKGSGGPPGDDLYGDDFYQGHEVLAIPVEFVVRNPCNGERVDVEGVLHISIGVVRTRSGVFQVAIEQSYSGLVGTGRTTGSRYRGGGATTINFVADSTDFYPAVDTFRETFVLAGPAKNKFVVKALFHVTVDADGHVRVDLDEPTGTDCIG